MGLDIYVYSKADSERNARHNQIWNERYYENPDYDSWSDEEKTAKRKEVSEAAGEYVYNQPVPSPTHPDSICNLTYLRSSYTSGGFNAVVRDALGVEGFYHIFEPLGREWDGDEGILTGADIPALKVAKERALDVAKRLAETEILRTLDATAHVGAGRHLWSKPPNEERALDWYRDERERYMAREHDDFGEAYTTAKGLVLGFTKGYEVLALTAGVDIIGNMCAIAIYRMPDEYKASYVASAEVCAELIDHLIGLIERDGAAELSWSG